jgi:hypothetical protein
MIHIQKELHIVSKSGMDCRWMSLHTRAKARVLTGLISVRGATRVIAQEVEDLNGMEKINLAYTRSAMVTQSLTLARSYLGQLAEPAHR